jgi:hypothetical protein
MTSANQRNRIVMFRLTQDEYNSLKSACAAAGGRNLSDYTRSELLALAHVRSRSDAIDRRFFEMNSKIDDLHGLVERILTRMKRGRQEPSLE